jgi:hypothetical protein
MVILEFLTLLSLPGQMTQKPKMVTQFHTFQHFSALFLKVPLTVDIYTLGAEI